MRSAEQVHTSSFEGLHSPLLHLGARHLPPPLASPLTRSSHTHTSTTTTPIPRLTRFSRPLTPSHPLPPPRPSATPPFPLRPLISSKSLTTNPPATRHLRRYLRRSLGLPTRQGRMSSLLRAPTEVGGDRRARAGGR
ncbi:hypothetical protein BCR35DRAFT_11989 [Leucosporidium creatinivorum]|uniref:Uncharacterized protein n=1 Tax=Leucosporidium creatinivorum TaxID=106004 RepID=A0A1Y2G6G1_9BASI|nr:hypothetical protein BCR35DRAFT_11989 [Leucosporidium creatinivorum]